MSQELRDQVADQMKQLEEAMVTAAEAAQDAHWGSRQKRDEARQSLVVLEEQTMQQRGFGGQRHGV